MNHLVDEVTQPSPRASLTSDLRPGASSDRTPRTLWVLRKDGAEGAGAT